MAEETLEYQLGRKLVGVFVRGGLIAAGASYATYVSTKTGTPAEQVVDPGTVRTFAEAASELVVALLAGLAGIALSAWEKIQIASKLKKLEDGKTIEVKTTAAPGTPVNPA